MNALILDRELVRDLIRERRESRGDRQDEVWNGIYVISPVIDIEHQVVRTKLTSVYYQALSGIPEALIYAGVNVSDHPTDWKKNYRCPDITVFLPGHQAEDRKTHYFGGPDFAVEVITPHDQARKKLRFYAKVGVRELLLIDRKPWSLELYRLADGELKLVGKILPDASQTLTSEVLPVSFRLLPGDARPTIEVTQTEDGRHWTI